MLDKYEKEIVKYCEGLKRKMLAKYRKGRKEHGGSAPVNLDCAKEINAEVLDILNYFTIHNVNKRQK